MANKTTSRPTAKTKRALTFWQGVNVRALQNLPVDLSTRQTAVLLQVYLSKDLHGIKDLADTLQISKPAICRAVDALEKLKLVKRKTSKEDLRYVYVAPTAKGANYLGKFANIIMNASQKAA